MTIADKVAQFLDDNPNELIWNPTSEIGWEERVIQWMEGMGFGVVTFHKEISGWMEFSPAYWQFSDKSIMDEDLENPQNSYADWIDTLAEAAEQRRYEDFHGSSRPQTQAERFEVDRNQKYGG